jgi:hypothetical protein
MKPSAWLIRIVGLLFFSANGATWAAEAPLPRPDHIVVVIEENHSYSKIIGNAEAPYINISRAGEHSSPSHLP